MKKILHILEGLFIITLIIIASLLSIKFLYKINNEKVDTEYLWNINFTNLQIKEGSKNGNIKLKDNQLTLDVKLDKEQQFYEFSIDIENKGEFKAKLDNLILDVDNPKNILTYKLAYKDGTTIKKGDIINPKTTQSIIIRVEYPKQKEKVYDALKLSLTLKMKYIASY